MANYQVQEHYEGEKRNTEDSKEERFRKYNLFRILLLYIIVGFLSWNIFFLAFTSSWFAIARITIHGNDYLTGDTIVETAKIGGFDNIFHFNTQRASQNFLKNPWVKEVTIKKTLPNQLDINIEERKPGAFIYANNHYYLVTEEGIILTKFEQFNNIFKQYVVTGLDIGNKKPGEIIENREYSEIRSIIYALDNLFSEQFYKIQIISEEEFLIFHRNNKIKVRIENGEQLINEWYLLESALQNINLEAMPLQEINMKYKERLLLILEDKQ